VGALLYELFCPERIKEFSATTWTDSLRKPYVVYIVESLRRNKRMNAAGIFTAIGAALILGLFVDRAYRALSIVIEYFLQAA